MSFNKIKHNEHLKNIASLGGKAVVKKYGKDHMARIGRKGGRAVVNKYGRLYMRKIGKRGFKATCDRYFNGDAAAMIKDLEKRGIYATDYAAREYGWYWQAEKPDSYPTKEEST